MLKGEKIARERILNLLKTRYVRAKKHAEEYEELLEKIISQDEPSTRDFDSARFTRIIYSSQANILESLIEDIEEYALDITNADMYEDLSAYNELKNKEGKAE